MKIKPSEEYAVIYKLHETLSQNNRYIEALTPVFQTAEAVVLSKRAKELKTKTK